MNGQRIWIKMGPYPIKVAFTTKPAVFKRELKCMGVPARDFVAINGSAMCHMFVTTTDWPSCIVCVAADRIKKSGVGRVAAIMAHEAAHVWQTYRETAGENNPGAEQEAYFLQYLTEHFTNIYYEETGQRKR